MAALGKQALRILAIGAETRHLQSGAVLFYAGELADGGYVVQEGSLLLEPGSLAEGGRSHRWSRDACRRAGVAYQYGLSGNGDRERADRRGADITQPFP